MERICLGVLFLDFSLAISGNDQSDKVSIQPEYQIVREGESVSIACTVNYTGNISLTWFKLVDDIIKPLNSSLNDGMQINNTSPEASILEINSSRLSHAGTYQCDDLSNFVTKKPAFLFVLDCSVSTSKPDNISFDDLIRTDCFIRYNGPATTVSIQLKNDGETFNQTTIDSIDFTKDNITNLHADVAAKELKDTTNYRCEISVTFPNSKEIIRAFPYKPLNITVVETVPWISLNFVGAVIGGFVGFTLTVVIAVICVRRTGCKCTRPVNTTKDPHTKLGAMSDACSELEHKTSQQNKIKTGDGNIYEYMDVCLHNDQVQETIVNNTHESDDKYSIYSEIAREPKSRLQSIDDDVTLIDNALYIGSNLATSGVSNSALSAT